MLDGLPDDVACSLLELLPLQDLVHVARLSRRFHSLVNGPCGERAWQRLFQEQFGSSGAGQQQRAHPAAAPQAAPGEPPPTKRARAARTAGAGQREEPCATVASATLPFLGLAGGAQQQQQQQQQGPGTSADGIAGPSAGPAQEQRSWKDRYRESYTEARQQLRLRRRAKVMKLESSVQVLSQEVHRLQQALREEAGRLDAARRELAAVQAERRAQAVQAISRQYWLPQAVQRAQGVVTSLSPVDLEGRETDARQRVAVCELELRKLRNQARQRTARLEEERRKLEALQP